MAGKAKRDHADPPAIPFDRDAVTHHGRHLSAHGHDGDGDG